MSELERYLSTTLSQVRCREMHAEIRAELEAHICDRAEEHEASGMEPAAAIQLALEQMGEPKALGAELDAAHRPRTEWGLLIATGVLVALGLVAMLALLGRGVNRPDYIFREQVMATGVGLCLAVALYLCDYRRIARFSPYLYLLTLIGTPVVLFLTRHRPTPHLLVQMTPLVYSVALAGIFARWRWERPGVRWLAGLLFAAPLLWYLRVPGLFPGAAYVLTFLTLMWASGARRSQLLPVGGLTLLAAGGVALGVMSRPYLLSRLVAWLQPLSDPQGMGYQTMQSVAAIRAAGPWGHGLLSHPELVPEVHTDFIFSYLVHALGWVGGAAVGLLVIFLMGRIWRVTRQVKDRFGSLLATGLLALFALHFGWNIAMALGLAPVMGVPLPFVSFGWSTAVQIAAMGLVAGVFRRKDMVPREA